MNYLYPIIRWIIFIPVSILGGQAFYAILIFINQIRPFGGSPGYIVSFSCAFLSGVVTIWLGAYLAPHFRKRVVIGYVIVTALGALSMIFLGTFLKYSFIENFRYIAHLMGIFGMGWLLYSNEISKAKENSID